MKSQSNSDTTVERDIVVKATKEVDSTITFFSNLDVDKELLATIKQDFEKVALQLGIPSSAFKVDENGVYKMQVIRVDYRRWVINALNKKNYNIAFDGTVLAQPTHLEKQHELGSQVAANVRSIFGAVGKL